MRLANTWNWVKLFLALLILPVVAMGGSFSVCSDHNEIVYVGNSNHGCYSHTLEEENHQEQPHEHQCTHVESEILPFVQVQAPVFDLAVVEAMELPDFRWCLSRMHSMVALALERTSYWEPPPTRTAPLLI